jgi:DNA polymerase-4
MKRTILYAEVPSFYASIERADQPAFVDRPLIVGGDPRKRGLVQSATADALAAGVTLEMPVIEALQRCPEARAVRTNMGRYREVSRQLYAWLRRGFGRLEPSGLGAAFFDLTSGSEEPEVVAARLRSIVQRELGLPLRVGIASGKLIARLAAEEAGEGGIRRVAHGDEQSFLSPLPVTRLEGVGEKTAGKLAELGAHTIGEIAAVGRERLEESLGTHGLRILAFAVGRDDRPVRATRHPQSMSREATLRGESRDLGNLAEHLQDLAQHLAAELRLQGLSAARVSLKLRFADQAVATRSLTLTRPAAAAPDIQAAALALLERTEAGSRPVRGLRLQVGGLLLRDAADRQLDLFPASS